MLTAPLTPRSTRFTQDQPPDCGKELEALNLWDRGGVDASWSTKGADVLTQVSKCDATLGLAREWVRSCRGSGRIHDRYAMKGRTTRAQARSGGIASLA